MNSWNILRSKMLSAMITLFFTGIIISGGSLVLLVEAFPDNLSYQACIAISTTFITGIVSISLARWSKEYVIIYREKPKEQQSAKLKEDQTITGSLNIKSLENILVNNEGPQRWMNEMCSQLGAGQAAVYRVDPDQIELKFGFALAGEKISGVKYSSGEGLIGRVATEGKPLYISPLPEGYITIYSGLGSSSPKYLTILPLKNNNEVVGILEVATFTNLDSGTREQLEKISGQISSFLGTKLER
jgi:transcriptional regulator with GAF, ATPase, and Fis domain